jgi:TolB-like protein/DNA-binding winged helix-turn-helix (wHTH) protein/Tfp pilus assembly protein PilF
MPDGVEKPPESDETRLRVGAWLIDPALNEISGGGKAIKLEPKAMEVLWYLAQRPAAVVSREALLAAIWPGVIVGDDSLTQAVIKLRKALGDTSTAPAYIQTIPKRGYRLVATVTRPEEPAQPAAPPSIPTRPVPPLNAQQYRRESWLTLAVVAALLLVPAAAWWTISDGTNPSTARGTTADVEATRAAQPSVTIVPFEALGDDPQAVVLARGITADLITDLLKLHGLSVITAGAASTSKSGSGNREQAAQYVVSGAVQRADDRLRLNVHLADVQSGQQLWSERFDRTVSDLFAVQEELERKILQTLPAKVSEAELRRVARPHTRNMQAYEYFQRGQMALIARQQPQNETAREMFRRAIELDPSFARAYADLALTYAADYRNRWTRDAAAALQRASELARTAHEINPDIRETYWVLAFVHLERREHKEALQQLETALRLFPSFADAYALMGGIHAYLGDAEPALICMRTAMRLNPDAGYLYFLILGRAYFALGDLEQARINLEHALLRNPVNLEARVYMAASEILSGNGAAARWEAEEIRALEPRFSTGVWLATHPLTHTKLQSRLASALKDLGLP